MNVAARIENERGRHTAAVSTNGQEQVLSLSARTDGMGSGVNGGELLCLALASCYCNDLYREARKRGIEVERVQVEVSAEFGGPGLPARGIAYRASVDAQAAEEEILELMCQTDGLAEVQKTLRSGVPVTLAAYEAHEVRPVPQS